MRALLSLTFVLAACGSPDDPDVEPFTDGSFTTFQVVAWRSCARPGCHAGEHPQAEMSLEPGSSYDAIVGRPAISLCGADSVRVVPGDPEASCLWQLVRDDEMPLEGGPLREDDKETIRAWIESGAPHSP